MSKPGFSFSFFLLFFFLSFLRSSTGGVVCVTNFNSSATWAATFRLRGCLSFRLDPFTVMQPTRLLFWCLIHSAVWRMERNAGNQNNAPFSLPYKRGVVTIKQTIRLLPNTICNTQKHHTSSSGSVHTGVGLYKSFWHALSDTI